MAECSSPSGRDDSRVIRNGVLDPTPIGPLPAMLARSLGGLLDVSLHPRFAENHLIYLAYSKPGPQGENDATTAVYRARWDGGSTHADGKDIFVANAYHGGPGAGSEQGPATGSYGSRLAWDKNGLMYVTLGDRNIGEMVAGTRLAHRQDRAAKDEAGAAGQPVRRQGWMPAGDLHTRPSQSAWLGLRSARVELWSTEEGPQGGES